MSGEITQRYVVTNAEFLVILGMLMGMLGFITAVSPLVAGLAVELVVGIMVLCRGSMQLYYGIKVRHWGAEIGSYMGLGSIAMSFLSVACAVVLLLNPLTGVQFLTLVLAAYLVVNGVVELLHAYELRLVCGSAYIVLNGLGSIALGAMIAAQWPLSGAFAIGVLFGVSMIMSGLSLVGLGMSGRRIRIEAAHAQAQQA